jgi:hypothetical protein
MEETEERKERLDTAEAALRDMYVKGSFPRDVYFAALLQIAEEWVDAEDLQEARNIVALLDEDYLSGSLPKLMRGDSVFHDRVQKIAKLLAPSVAGVDDSEVDVAILRGPIGKA